MKDISTKLLSYSEGDGFCVEASTLEANGHKDWCTCDPLILVSHKTGNKVAFTFDRKITSPEGELFAWVYISVKINETLTIFND
jgi:hypothetical protein